MHPRWATNTPLNSMTYSELRGSPLRLTAWPVTKMSLTSYSPGLSMTKAFVLMPAVKLCPGFCVETVTISAFSLSGS